MLKTKLVHDPVNKCIYCGSTKDLTDEHIIPFGLGGEHILPKASCKDCAKITAGFEQEVLRGVWWLARALLKFPTRRPKDMPTSFKLQVETKDGQSKEIVLDEKEKFAVAGFLEFAPPAFLSPREFTPGILITGHRVIGFGTSIEDLAKNTIYA